MISECVNMWLILSNLNALEQNVLKDKVLYKRGFYSGGELRHYSGALGGTVWCQWKLLSQVNW